MSSFSLMLSSAVSAPKVASTKVSSRRSVVMRAVEEGPRHPVEKGPSEPLPTDTPAEVPPTSAPEGSQASPAVAPGPGKSSLADVMNFGGSAPEITNGRLAMLGFVAALGAELSSGQSVLRQISDEPALINLTFVVFIAASLITVSQSKKAESVGPFTPDAELINGRAAMIGFASLLAVEAFNNGAALF